MAWNVEYSDEFGDWWGELTAEEQEDVAASVGLLERRGPNLGYPFSSDVKGARTKHMRELRVQHQGRPYRVLTPSIRGGTRSSYWVEIRPGMIAGTSSTSRLRTGYTSNI